MDMLSMLMNAKIMDEDGNEIGEVVGFTINGGKMMLSTDIDFELLYDEDDPDGGEEIDVDDKEESDPEKKMGNIKLLRMVGERG